VVRAECSRGGLGSWSESQSAIRDRHLLRAFVCGHGLSGLPPAPGAARIPGRARDRIHAIARVSLRRPSVAVGASLRTRSGLLMQSRAAVRRPCSQRRAGWPSSGPGDRPHNRSRCDAGWARVPVGDPASSNAFTFRRTTWRDGVGNCPKTGARFAARSWSVRIAVSFSWLQDESAVRAASTGERGVCVCAEAVVWSACQQPPPVVGQS
jgi:hypothetical protein